MPVPRRSHAPRHREGVHTDFGDEGHGPHGRGGTVRAVRSAARCIGSGLGRLARENARRLWGAFWRDDGYTIEQTEEAARDTAAAAAAMPRTFVLPQDGEPVGTASLTEHDLDERSDLSPWVVGVFVEPRARGRGHATRPIAAVEHEARAQSIPALWLYTLKAEALYARAGWRTVETVRRNGQPHAPMRRGLPP